MKYMPEVLKAEYHQKLIDFIVNNRDKMGDTLVNIGLDYDVPSANWLSVYLDDLGFKKVYVIEAFPKNARLIYTGTGHDDRVKVHCADICDAVEDDSAWDQVYDTCFWGNGPEHVAPEKLKVMFPKLFARISKLFLGWCPYGDYYGESKVRGNPWQTHQIIDPTPGVFDALDVGLTSEACVAEKNTPDSFMYTYKWISNET